MNRPAPVAALPRLTVGVFDSGFGGLTVLRELLALLPGAHFVYLGDTARLPYGAKSKATVARYAVEAARFLVDRGAALLVIACNTATALALEDIRSAVSVPVIGVIEPGARAAADACRDLSRDRDPAPGTATPKSPGTPPAILPPSSQPQAFPSILVLATAATVDSHAYRDTCARFGLQTTEKACPLLVPLVEEGWTDHLITRDVLRVYLGEALAEVQPAAVLLGCTHYPLLAAEITKALAELHAGALIIDSAHATARAAQEHVGRLGAALDPAAAATFECFATDSVEKFARLGALFLGRPMPSVVLLDLGG